MKLSKFTVAYAVAAFALPMLALAQAQNIQDLGQTIIDIINTVLVPLIFALAFIVFLWGVFQYFIAGASDEEKREAGKSLMIYGLIGFFVMVSVWGLVNLLVGTFNLNDSNIQGGLPHGPGIGD
jgi:NADH:ubiquinone oxidoreductase subunit 2 (subunit N)